MDRVLPRPLWYRSQSGAR